MINGVEQLGHSRPELQLGFKAMRRKEILDYAKRFEDIIGPIDGRLPKDALATMMEGYLLAEKIPHPYQPAQSQVEELREEMARKESEKDAQIEEMRQQLAALTAKLTPEASPVEASPVDMRWNDLQKHAKAKGIEVAGRSREDLLKDLGYGADAASGAEPVT